NSGVFSIHDDQTGRPLAITAPNSGAIVWAAGNLPFGYSSVYTNTFGDFNIGYPGQYLDEETGLWHNGNRDYAWSIGRYIESDPIGLAGGINTYAYVGNNPITGIDPLGLCPTCTQLQQKAAQLAGVFNNTAKVSGALAFASALGVGIAGYGEGPTFGIDTPVTVSFGSAMDFFGAAALFTHASGAVLSSFASGNLTAIGNFDFSSIAGIAANAAASRIPGVSGFAENVGQMAEQAADIAADAQAACQRP
ncbi:MAG: RHS repeat-associated core domain-containing protein, partial [Rhodanobacteraceae bacterium]